MNKLALVGVLSSFLLASVSYGAEVKVMRGLNLIEGGENCKLIGEEEAYKITMENMKDTYGSATTLKQMISEGWKIEFVKELPTKYRTEFLFILTKG